jgi:multidrug efflux pump subunit AcrA (membrane-fusion protein)
VTIDGVARAIRVLGALRAAGTGAASPALLLELRGAPAGLSPGIRVAITLDGDMMPGFSLPGTALLFDEKGAHVYQEVAGAPDAAKTTYARRNVELLMPFGDGWLVHGVDADDRIVVRGVGLLWSMQGGTADDVD